MILIVSMLSKVVWIMLNSEQNVEECDAIGFHSSIEAGS